MEKMVRPINTFNTLYKPSRLLVNFRVVSNFDSNLRVFKFTKLLIILNIYNYFKI